jgi:hypothetical protein
MLCRCRQTCRCNSKHADAGTQTEELKEDKQVEEDNVPEKEVPARGG